MNFETKAIRIQTDRTAQREHSTPIFPTSSFVFDDAEQMRALFADELEGNVYSRFTNPNCQEFEQKMAALEGVDTAVATGSGMAAVFASMMGLLRAGDHLLATKAIFGATRTVIDQFLPRWGIECTYLDGSDVASWQAAVRPTTKMFFLETPSNPGLDIVDLAAAGQFCRENGLIFNVDNCFATPYLQQPALFGADIITHSATKFIDGQGRVMGGVVAGRADLLVEIKKFCRSTGPSLSPFNAWILSKSLETLAVRMDRHCENARALALFFSKKEGVQNVKYPFLESHQAHEIAKKQMKNGGGLLTFELTGGLDAGRRFLDALELCSLSANLGDTRTIATHPASTTHAKLTAAARLDSGITDGLIRISVGLEHVDDLIFDLERALNQSGY